MLESNEIYLTIDEYAAQENVSRRTVQRWISRGLIFSAKIKNRRYIPAEEPSPQDLGTFEEERPKDEPVEGTPDDITTPEDEPDFSGGEISDDPDCEGCPCDTPPGVDVVDPETIDRPDLRKIFPNYADALMWAEPIGCGWYVIRRTNDCLYQVIVIPSD